jgi:hypothetical protein
MAEERPWTSCRVLYTVDLFVKFYIHILQVKGEVLALDLLKLAQNLLNSSLWEYRM